MRADKLTLARSCSRSRSAYLVGRRDRDPALADGDDPGRRRCATRAEAIARRGRRAPRSSTPKRSPAAARCPGSTIPSVGVAVDAGRRRRGSRARAARPRRRRAGRRRRASSATCAPSIPTTTRAASTRCAAARATPTREGRRHRGPRRPRQVVARPRAHRHRSRPLRGGEGARAHHRPRLRVHHAAVGHRGRLRRRARPRAVRQEHARRRRRGRRRAARRRRRRRAGCRRARSTSAILELLGVRHGLVALTKADTVDADDARARAARGRRAPRGARRSRDAPVVVCDSVSGRGLDDVRAALDAVLAAAAAPARPSAGRGSGSTACSRRVAPARSSPARSPGGAVAVDDDAARSCGRPRRCASAASRRAHRRVDARRARARGSRSTSPGSSITTLARGDALVRAGPVDGADVVDVAVTPVPGEQLPGCRHGSRRTSGRASTRCRSASLDDDGRLRPPAVRRARSRSRPATASCCATRRARARRRRGGARRRVAVRRLVAPRVRARPGRSSRGCSPGTGGCRATTWPAWSASTTAVADALPPRSVDRGDAVASATGWRARRRRRALCAARRVRGRSSITPTSRCRPGSSSRALAGRARVDPAQQVRAALDGDDTLVVDRGRRARRRARVTRGRRPTPRRALLAALDAHAVLAAGAAPDAARSSRALVREGALVDVDGIVFTASTRSTAPAHCVRDALVDARHDHRRRRARRCSAARGSTWSRSSSGSTARASPAAAATSASPGPGSLPR